MIASVIEKRPFMGYIVSALSGAGGWVAFFDVTKGVLGVAASVFAVAAGYYTFRIQKRSWDQKLGNPTNL